MKDRITIAIVGSGYVGLVAAACLAELGHQVICVDNDRARVDALRQGNVPIHEEFLPELLHRHRGKALEFSTDLTGAVRQAEVIFIAVGTPPTPSGTADLSYVDAVATQIAHAITSYKLIVEKSTVPVYTNEWIRRVVERNGVARDMFDVASNPEFLREGTAVVDFLHPDRVVIGTDTERAAELLLRVYAPLSSGTYYDSAHAIPGSRSTDQPAPILVTSTKAAELIKHASNAFLAMKISFVNAVANICESAGADVEQVARGMGLDSRIGSRFLRAGIGYGGSCFPKDVSAFRHVAEQLGMDFGLLREVEKINAEQKARFFHKVHTALWTLRGKRLGVLGLAFKGGTDDVRDSPALELIEKFLGEGCIVQAYDPAAEKRAAEVIPPSSAMQYVSDPYAAAQGADALLILSDWQEFAELDLARLRHALRYPVVVDGRNLYSPERMEEQGFAYFSMGRPAVRTQQFKPLNNPA